jgi:hypothetical protein
MFSKANKGCHCDASLPVEQRCSSRVLRCAGAKAYREIRVHERSRYRHVDLTGDYDPAQIDRELEELGRRG